jgi:hypothetical protein
MVQMCREKNMIGNRNPFHALGLVFSKEVPGGRFLGTTFAYNNSHCFLTAAHCVRDRSPESLVIVTQVDVARRAVTSIVHHPTADVCVLKVVAPATDPVAPFIQCARVLGWGEEYLALGYPEDSSIRANETRPTLRSMRGHYQRLLQYKSNFGYEYAAGEVSTPFPEGMSGGPLFSPELPVSIIGLAAENFRWGREIESTEDITENGQRTRIENYAYVRYGIAVMLFDIRDWLDPLAPLSV